MNVGRLYCYDDLLAATRDVACFVYEQGDIHLAARAIGIAGDELFRAARLAVELHLAPVLGYPLPLGGYMLEELWAMTYLAGRRLTGPTMPIGPLELAVWARLGASPSYLWHSLEPDALAALSVGLGRIFFELILTTSTEAGRPIRAGAYRLLAHALAVAFSN